MPTKREQFTQTIRSQYLGQRMRQLREARGLTLKYVAGYLGVEFSTLARYERAEWPFRKDHVEGLLDVYCVFEEREREELLILSRTATRLHQWEQQGGHNRDTAGVQDRVFIDPQWILDRAEELRIYQPALIPDLLCTREYTEAVLRHIEGPHASVQRITHQVRHRMQRQQILDDKPPLRLKVLLEEAVLRRPVGNPTVLCAQLEHLVRVIEQRPHVEIYILPVQAGWHEGVYGAFTVVEPRERYPLVTLLEHYGGSIIVEEKIAEQYGAAFDRLTGHAYSATTSIALISDLAAKLDAGIDIWAEPALIGATP